ncbi:MAG: 4-(cytidine 5'-diphospho)-2-C-methyl-D-erythritol kinase [Nitrospirota bacterium]|nr:4-(cytidine 5'-diphospho)-2-C-methyl-D-erythritol kinase [Nitrospirota bacterium]MDX2420270.1 4-(cytidine 5'-diphospho)-2-C-methyl-D-erythritol kinase [Nitrospirota bacterium]
MGDSAASENEIIVQAPAKVNLCIRVLDRLPNGYHGLWSLMHSVDLFDQIRIGLNPTHNQVQLTCHNALLPVDRENLVYRAAEAVLRRAKLVVGLDIELRKAIPLAAGLGGGSSDAAATIYGLGHLLKLEWELSEMSEVGAALGSDIPFFFQAPCALVGGWGQEVTSCTIDGKRWVVLVNPGFPVQTKWAYEQLSSNRSGVPPLSSWAEIVERQLHVSWDDVIKAMENDFESPLFPLYPILGFIKDKLCSLGAQAALLSGSGATVFGLFLTCEAAKAAAAKLRRDTQWSVFDVPMGSTELPHTPILRESSSEALSV